jgi:tagaturonate reductase
VVDARVEGASAFAQETMQRFANPFLDHKLSDIAVYHEQKIETRLMPTYREYKQHFGQEPVLLSEILKPFL